MKITEAKMQKLGKRIFPPLIWAGVVMFIIVLVILIYWLITDKTIKTLGQLTLVLLIIFVTIFIVIFTLLVTKYKKEAILNDYERERKWDSLSYGYKRFFRRIMYAGMGIYICMILVGVYSLIYPKDGSLVQAYVLPVVGLVLLFSAYMQLKRMKKLDHKQFKKKK